LHSAEKLVIAETGEGDPMTKTGQKAMLLLRMICAVSLLMLGLAHQAPQEISAELRYDAATYVLPDGTYASLCITFTDSDGKTVAFKPNCETCRLSASVILPTPDAGLWLHHSFASLHNPLRQEAAVLGTSSVSRPNSRAPPAVA
jgi:hypothetical protein